MIGFILVMEAFCLFVKEIVVEMNVSVNHHALSSVTSIQLMSTEITSFFQVPEYS